MLGFGYDTFDVFLSFSRDQLKRRGLCFALLIGSSVQASGEFDLDGAWQRVYNTCGAPIPSSEEELYSWSRGQANLREMTLFFSGEQFAAVFLPSQHCVDKSLKTEFQIDCVKGKNEGRVSILPSHYNQGEMKRLYLNADERADKLSFWGGGIGGNHYFYQVVNNVLILSSKADCPNGELWSIYFVRFPFV